MQTDYYTFWSLLDNPEIKHIQVPRIQRDYAQGRRNEKANSIRSRLLDALHLALAQQQPLTLDFVYGEIHAQTRLFVPLDGQQRLTTLFLLHWYLALVAGKLPDARTTLSKFTYETRSSSREFCERLVNETLLPGWETYPALSEALRDTTWFQPAWERDPTVVAMLVMLDALAQRFGSESDWFERLTAAESPLIGFYFLDMPKVGLTDDLYLKMNARGKPLTDFENWKAEFDLLLQHQGWPDLQAEFGRKADTDWTDLFWKYRRKDETVVDEVFEQYLHFLTRMLAYQEGESNRELVAGRLSFGWFRHVYAERKNVEFLFKTLDFLAALQTSSAEGIAGLLGRLLTKQSENERVRLFGESQPDIFSQCLQEANPSRLLQEQVLLFSLLTYGATVDPAQFAEADARNLLRVLRNLMERKRQQQDTQIGSDLRVDDLPAFVTACAALATAENGVSPKVYDRLVAGVALPGLRRVEHERIKARLLTEQPELTTILHELEDQVVFRGDLHNLLPTENVDKLVVFGQAVREIWAGPLTQSLIIRAWLTLDDYAVSQDRWTGGAEKYFFGNTSNWYTVLAFDLDDDQKNLLPAFLQAYTDAAGTTPVLKLEQLINTWLATNHDFSDWRYYFIKYPEMTEESQAYFAWYSDFTLRLLRRNGIGSKHINPYVRAIARRGKVKGKITSDQWVYNKHQSPLWLNIPSIPIDNWDAALYCEDEGWRLTLPVNYSLPAMLEATFDLHPDAEGHRWLRVTAEQDRIERAEDFIAALHTQGVLYQEPNPLVDVAG